MLRFVFLALALAALAAYIAHYAEYDRKGMDMPSYLLVKLLNTLLVPKAYPSNARNAKLWRHRTSKSKKAKNFNFLGSVYDIEIHAEDGTPLASKIYRPSTQSDPHPLPVVMWIHGGGWVIGDIEVDNGLAAKLSAYTNMVVVSVSYRMAPEHLFPAAAVDIQQALNWIKMHIHVYGGIAEDIFVAGESSGANLAAAITSWNLDSASMADEERIDIKGTVLVYPPLASECNFSSFSEFDSLSLLTTAQMRRFWEVYAGNQAPSPRENYLFAPLYTPPHILRRYPPTITVVAKYDVLADDSMEFASRLRTEGVQLEMKVFPTSTHGFFGVDELPQGDDAVRYVANELIKISKSAVSID
jgi:acetyl esterase